MLYDSYPESGDILIEISFSTRKTCSGKAVVNSEHIIPYESRIVFSTHYHFTSLYIWLFCFIFSFFFFLFHLSQTILWFFFAVRFYSTLNNLESSSNLLITLLTVFCRSLMTALSRKIPCTYPCGILLLTSWEK